jgi:energy-coupling factor transporter ATP-binding protein EcfA2
MRLLSFRVTNYRSVEDSGEVKADDLVCLVGKNEAGKTALLQALTGLNPHPSTPREFDKETDYPRRFLQEYSARHPTDDATIITTAWSIDDADAKAIREEIGSKGLKSEPVEIYRRYNDKGPKWTVPVDYPEAVQHLLDDERLTAQEKKPLTDVSTSDAVRKTLEALGERTERQQRLLDRLNKYPGKNIRGFVEGILQSKLPQFMYFSHYDRMVGQIRVDTLQQRKQQGPAVETGEQVFLDFLEYAGTSAEEISGATTYESLNARCESASNAITDQLRAYWTQNPFLEIEVRVTKAETGDPPPFNAGTIVRNRVKNTLHRVSVPFSERSAGFIWFFSFLVRFAQVQKSGGKLVLLLDEPGLTLHGKAQEDLLRYFDDKLIPHHQLIFSTHSPFMVPADKLEKCRIVEDRIKQGRPGIWTTEGTKVSQDSLVVDQDSIFPLQGALGYNITQSLFVGKNTLLVEGPGDVLFLHVLSAALKRRGRTNLDSKWTLCPAGGIDKIQSFVSLFSAANLHIASLSDYAVNDKKKLENLRQSRLLASDRVMTFAEILGSAEADVEDIFAREIYAEIVNGTLGLTGQNTLTIAKLDANAGGAIRLLKQTENACKLLPPEVPEFDHYSPADWLARNPSVLDGDSASVADTLDRAEKVFKFVNNKLPAG